MELSGTYEQEPPKPLQTRPLDRTFRIGFNCTDSFKPVRCDLKNSTYFFLRPREIITRELEAESKIMFGEEIEVEENYFGGRKEGKRDHGAAGNVPVFDLPKRDDKIYTNTIHNASLTHIIEEKVVTGSIVYSHSSRGYNVPDI